MRSARRFRDLRSTFLRRFARPRWFGRAASPAETRCGAALVETALVLPIFMMILVGIVEFGRAFMVANMLAESARHGARIAIVPGATNTSVESEVKSRVSELAHVAAADVTVAITITPDPRNSNPNGVLSLSQKRDLVTVAIQVPFSKVNLVPIEWLSSVNLSARCSMRHE